MIIARWLLPPSLFAAAALGACTTATATTVYTPVTGIQVPSADVAQGHGCGTGSDQVYRYIAVISYPSDASTTFSTTAVFDCFADGLFSNLPFTNAAASQPFNITIFAFNQASFPAALDCVGSPCPGDDAGEVALWTGTANWTGKCQATEVSGVTALATCAPLEPLSGSGVADAGEEP